MVDVEQPSLIRVLYIYGVGGNPEGEKAKYLQRRFKHVHIPARLKHSDHKGTRETLSRAVAEFRPDIIVAHAAGAAKALSLANAGVWQGTMVLLGGGRACTSIADVLGQAITVVIPSRDAEAPSLKRAVRSSSDKDMVIAVEVNDESSLNTSMVDEDKLSSLITRTVERQNARLRATKESDPETPVCDQVRWMFSEALADDGHISPEEFHDIFRQIDPSMSQEQVSNMAKIFFAEKGRTIDIDDFIQWVFSSERGQEREEKLADSGTTPLIVASMESSSVNTTALVVTSQDTVVPPILDSSPEDFASVEKETPSGVADVETSCPPELVVDPIVAVAPVVPGQLFTWGRGSDGQLGQDRMIHPNPNCALPYPVPGFHNVVHVACGGGQQGSTAVVTASGELYTFGNNFKGRLGHGEGPSVREPRRVEALAKEVVLTSACGPDHSAALVSGGRVFLWGSNRHGQLGRGHAEKGPDCMQPAEVALPSPAAQIDCEDQYSAAVLKDGRVFSWGCNEHGRLGIGSNRATYSPTIVLSEASVSAVNLGSLYAGAIGSSGELLMWGYGGHGNLGLGSRASVNVPSRVELGEPAAQVACTRGQDGCKGGLNPSSGGHEGPHTVVVSASGALYTFGTCHKGLLCNLGNKDGAFGKPWDELRPYRVGGKLRNGCDNPPLSPLAVWPPPYDSIGPVSKAVSAHIHAACIGADGKAWAWGCGSNDGRCGVERFLNMKGEGKPPQVDMMKCYMMGPHRIGLARALYWRHASLQGHRVSLLATGRNHMACIANLDEDVEAE